MYGIYIHIPFCTQKCPYCDFYSVTHLDQWKGPFLRALHHQIASFAPVHADTIYFGGGTPSLLSPDDIASILEDLGHHHRLSSNCEISMECNPASLTPSGLSRLYAAGINRLSIGCQSFQPEGLKSLGRLHTAQEAIDTVWQAYDAGFRNISVDLMLGTPVSSVSTAIADAKEALSLPITHLSAYLLKLAPGTPFGDFPPELPPEESQAQAYEAFCSEMAHGGFVQYEISNYAKEGYACRHNLKYWQCGQWLGLGPAAHMSTGARRYSFPSDLSRYCQLFDNGPLPDPLAPMTLEGTVDAEEELIMSLRTTAGTSRTHLKTRWDYSFTSEQEQFLSQCRKEGFLTDDGDAFALTSQGFLLSNSILSELIP